MGSKAALLNGPLGKALLANVHPSTQFTDLFAGSGVVGQFVAERCDVAVTSVDQQAFSRALSMSVIGRNHAIDPGELVASWLKPARENFDRLAEEADFGHRIAWTFDAVQKARALCEEWTEAGFIVRHYGGHYFSPAQSLALQCLLPDGELGRDATYWLKLGVVIRVASQVSASPGHTAQPFQPTTSLLPFIDAAWRRDVFAAAEVLLSALAPRHAQRRGKALLGDAATWAARVARGSTVFCDPPYSDVQYSRFYHVLEGIARGGWSGVNGAGRSPELALRSSSKFSYRSQSTQAITDLLEQLASREATVLFTFPAGEASNGMSGDGVRTLARRHFRVRGLRMPHTHSTLGGPAALAGAARNARNARKPIEELLLVMTPK